MNTRIAVLFLILALCVPVLAHAVPAGKTLTFSGSKRGVVEFSGDRHSNRGYRCTDCHRKGVFPKMRKGAAKITMGDIYAGKYCGACHNSVTAFGPDQNCSRCHGEKPSK